MREGIFGGTFNPPHIGHLICAQEARWQLGLDGVVLMPVGEAPHKQIEQDPGREVRHELCRLAATGNEWLSVSRHEIEKQGPAYTVETLREARRSASGDELFLIMGGDQAAGLAGWQEPEEILRLATVAVAERPLAGKREIREALAGVSGSERIVFFSMPAIEVSSTMVRERVADGRPIRHLVPDGVADQVERAGLYRPGVSA